LLVITCAAARPSLGHECSAEKMDNAVIDVNRAVPTGVGGAEPVYAPSPEACVRACCSGEKLSGDKKCNLIIFDAQRTSTLPNCYLFYCPSTEACPMKPATGLVSYRITEGTHSSEDTSFRSEVFPSSGYSLSSDAGAFISHSQTGHQNHTAVLQQSVFRQAPELQNHVDEHLDNTEFHTAFPDSQRANHPESLDPLPRKKVINLPPSTSSPVRMAKPSALFPTTQSSVPEPSSTTLSSLPTSTTRLESQTTSLPAGDLKPTTDTTTTTATVLPTVITTAKPGILATTHIPLPSLTTSASTIKQMTTNSRFATTPSGLRTAAILPEQTVAPSNNTSHVTRLSFSGFVLSASDSPTASQNDPRGYDPSNSENYLPENVLRGKGVVQLGEKSSLVAALLFGVIFLLLVIALTGKKIHESLQKRHYTRLDYLINGMYADV
ncbi:MANS1 protein, partial [Chloroceryle aenea]|nr:MANS1 protein [Chloroceryle aenea]